MEQLPPGRNNSKPTTVAGTTPMLPSFPAASLAPSSFSPTSEGEEGATTAGGYYAQHFPDDATLMAAMQTQATHQRPHPPLPPLETPLLFYGDGYPDAPAALLQADLLRLVGVLEAENQLLETLALGRLQQGQGPEGEEEVAETIEELRDARALLDSYETERLRLAGACDRWAEREAALARWAGLPAGGEEAVCGLQGQQQEGGGGAVGVDTGGLTPLPALRRALAAARRERDVLGERVAELGKEVHTAERRAAAAEASAVGRVAALETQVRALERRLRERGGAVEAAVAAARAGWEQEAEAVVAQVLSSGGALAGGTEEDDRDASVAAAAGLAAEEREEGGHGEDDLLGASGAGDGDWRARLVALTARRRREGARQRRRLLATFQKLVAERVKNARVEGEVAAVRARLVGVEEEFRRRLGAAGPAGAAAAGGGSGGAAAALVEEAERQRDAARVELAASRAAADSARTRVGALEAEVQALRARVEKREREAEAIAEGRGAVVDARVGALEEENVGLRAAVAEAEERTVWLQAELVKARERATALEAAAAAQQQAQPQQEQQQRVGGPAVAEASPFAGTGAGRKRLDAAFAGVVEEGAATTGALQPTAAATTTGISSRAALLLAQGSPSTAADAARLRRLAGEMSDALRVAGGAAAAELAREKEALLGLQVEELEGIKARGRAALAATRAAGAAHARALLRAQAAGVVAACWWRWRRRRRSTEEEEASVLLPGAFARWRAAAVAPAAAAQAQEGQGQGEEGGAPEEGQEPPTPPVPPPAAAEQEEEGEGPEGVEESKARHQRARV